jgi:hypothetical protein
MRFRLTQSYQKAFEVAPRVHSGEWVSLEWIDPKNAAWFFGQNAQGIVGFFPVDWFAIDDSKARAKRDYDASELNASQDQFIEVQESYGRWLLVTNERGETGWIPQECVE